MTYNIYKRIDYDQMPNIYNYHTLSYLLVLSKIALLFNLRQERFPEGWVYLCFFNFRVGRKTPDKQKIHEFVAVEAKGRMCVCLLVLNSGEKCKKLFYL